MSDPAEAPQAAELVRRLRRLDCCAVSDALDKLGLTGLITGVPRRSGEGCVVGRAVTVKLGIGAPPPGPPRHLGTAAVEAAGPDNVIVVEQRAVPDTGCWGGILSLGAKLRGVAGVLADGPVRDIDEAAALGFPIFTRSMTARTGRGRVVELAVNEPIQFETVTVSAGDYVIADSSGIVFIGPDKIGLVLETAEMIAAKEAAMAKALREGKPITQVMGADYERMLKS
jgi:regulator of RNase E activity RraA